MNKWYAIHQDSDKEAVIEIYEEIGMWGVSAKQFLRELEQITAPTIRLRLNCPGGEVFDGTAIYNALKDHDARILVEIDGLAASMASVIAMAGDEITMAENAYLMIHNPWTVAVGEAKDMRKTAEILEKIEGTLAKVYASRTGGEVKEFVKLMNEETWFTAEEAKEAGLVDDINPNKGAEGTAAASAFDLSAFARVPEPLKKQAKKPAANSIRRMAALAQTRERIAHLSDQIAGRSTSDDIDRILDRAANLAGSPDPSQSASVQPGQDPKEPSMITLAQFNEFAAANPDAVKSFEKQGYDKGKADGITEGKAAAAEKPADITELEAAFPGEEKFVIEQLKAKATMSGATKAFNTVLKDRLKKATDAANSGKGQGPIEGTVGGDGSTGNNGDGKKMSAERRKELLSQTPEGQAILRNEAAAQNN